MKTRTVAFGLLVVALLTVPARAAIINATLVEDTFIASSAGTTNYAADRFIQNRAISSVTRGGLIQFDLPVLPANERVIGATLTLYGGIGDTDSFDLEMGATTASINLSTLTWANAITSGVITGVDTNKTVAWGSSWSRWSELWHFTGISTDLTAMYAYTDTTADAGMLKFIQDSISNAAAVRLTFGIDHVGTESVTASVNFRSSNDTGVSGSTAVATGSAGWPTTKAPTLTLTTEAIPEPATLSLLAIGGVILMRRRNR